MPTSKSVWWYVAFTGLVFGSGSLVSKALVDDGVDAFTLVWFPFLLGGSLAFAVSLRTGRFRRAALRDAALLGVVASACPAILFNIGFEKLPAGIVTLLISLGPVFTAVLAHYAFDDERFNRIKAAGLGLAVAGVGLLAAGSLSGGASGGGMALVTAGSLVAGASAVLTRRIASDHGAEALIGPQLLTAGLVALTLSPLLGRPLSPSNGFETWQLLTLTASGITSFLGFRGMLKANEIGTTGQVSVIGYCIPLFGVVGGIVFFDDPVTLSLIAGGALIVVSVGVIASGSRAPAAIEVIPAKGGKERELGVV